MKNDIFTRFANGTAEHMGNKWTFILSLGVVLLWLISGPVFHYSDTWQLIINTSTTIITFLAVFLIQNTQNRNDKAVNLKIDELIKSNKGARNSYIELEDMDEGELNKLKDRMEQLYVKKKNVPKEVQK